jgi:hypothetical protein
MLCADIDSLLDLPIFGLPPCCQDTEGNEDEYPSREAFVTAILDSVLAVLEEDKDLIQATSPQEKSNCQSQ